MQGLGRHILAEFYGCDFARLNDPELLGPASLDAVERSGATVMSHHVKTFEPQGVSGVVIIAESHLSFHTWPEHGYAAVDYFTCGDSIDIHLAVDIMAETLQAARSERTLHWRGTDLADELHRPAEGYVDRTPEGPGDRAPEGPGDRAPERPRISDHAADEEHWITEYHLDRRTGRRQLGTSYLSQEKVVRERSLVQDIAVAKSPIYGRMLFIGGYLMTTEADEFVYHEMLAHVPMVLHPGPRRVLIIGGGDGGLLREVLRHDTVERVDLVEIDEQVIEISRTHLPGLVVGFNDPRVRLHIQDGAQFVGQAGPASYDVALVDSTDPIGSARVLFEAPFFRALQRVLSPEGLVAAQSLSPWVQAAEQREMYGELGAVWPHVLSYHATVPTYPGGLWTFACCSNHTLDLTGFDRARATRVGQHCQYYTPELQVAAFHLPRFVVRNTVEIAQAHRDRAPALDSALAPAPVPVTGRNRPRAR